ncbi:MAG: STAS domain-containing protein [Planctomycetes bacterium]|nr:STAS domain-containing protein [Planctomycetota bacterium]
MKISTQNYNDVTVVELHGDFTSEFSKPFEDAVKEVIQQGAAGIVLDMTHISFIDSLSLEQILWLRDYCNDKLRQLKIAGLDETCEKILSVTRLEKQLDTYEELSEAVKSFA